VDTIEAISSRRSIRRFRGDPVPQRDLLTILEAGRLAPSARNRQPWHFVVVTDKATKVKLAGACMGQVWLAAAPVMIVALGFPNVDRGWYVVDVCIALENMVLAATALGYGTCWIGAFQEGLVKRIVGAPDEARVIALSPVGVPAEHPGPRSRKDLAEVCSVDRYGEPYRGPAE
jgi:nitroreductase